MGHDRRECICQSCGAEWEAVEPAEARRCPECGSTDVRERRRGHRPQTPNLTARRVQQAIIMFALGLLLGAAGLGQGCGHALPGGGGEEEVGKASCETADDCPAGKAACVGGQCYGCRMNVQCPTGRPYCLPEEPGQAAGRCVQCLTGGDCSGGGSCINFHCVAAGTGG